MPMGSIISSKNKTKQNKCYSLKKRRNTMYHINILIFVSCYKFLEAYINRGVRANFLFTLLRNNLEITRLGKRQEIFITPLCESWRKFSSTSYQHWLNRSHIGFEELLRSWKIWNRFQRTFCASCSKRFQMTRVFCQMRFIWRKFRYWNQ